MQKSMDVETVDEAIDFTLQTTETAAHVDTKTPQEMPEVIPEVAETEPIIEAAENPDQIFVTDNGFLMLHKDHPEYMNLIRLQLENQELINWKQQLQARINLERAECVRLKRMLGPTEAIQDAPPMLNPDDPEYERLVEHYMKENALLEQKRVLLAKEILEENISLIQLQVDLAIKQFVH